MPVRLESDVEKRVCKDAEDRGWWALKLVCVGHRGFPDRWFIREQDVKGEGSPRIVIMEFKAPGKRARKLQLWVCKKLEDMGFEVYWDVDDYDIAMELLK